MTEKLYDIDSHLKEFDAVVLDSYPQEEGFITILDKTAFFPEGGGQHSDIGYIDDAKVYDVQISNGVIYHYTTKLFEKGEKVHCKIDWQRRFEFMQQHSGEHIISGIVHSIYGYDNVGFYLGETEMTMDFDGILTRKDLDLIEQKANEAIYENAKFNCFYPENLNGLEYRSKLDLSENVRIVEIENYDKCACCAPHVNSACEIGMIKILDFCKNKGGVRIWAVCGNRALEDYKERYQNTLEISSLLCTPQQDIAQAVKKQGENIDDLKYQIGGLKRRLIGEISKGFKTEKGITPLFQDEFDIKELQLLADTLHKTSDGIIAVFSGEKNEFAFAICGQEEKLSLIFNKFKSKLCVRGGGRGEMVQGTVLATKEEILGVINELD